MRPAGSARSGTCVIRPAWKIAHPASRSSGASTWNLASVADAHRELAMTPMGAPPAKGDPRRISIAAVEERDVDTHVVSEQLAAREAERRGDLHETLHRVQTLQRCRIEGMNTVSQREHRPAVASDHVHAGDPFPGDGTNLCEIGIGDAGVEHQHARSRARHTDLPTASAMARTRSMNAANVAASRDCVPSDSATLGSG